MENNHYPFDFSRLVGEIKSIEALLDINGVHAVPDEEIEKRYCLASGALDKIRRGIVPAEDRSFCDYAFYLAEVAETYSDYVGPLSDNYKAYMEWENNGWVNPRHHYAFVVRVLEQQIENLNTCGITASSEINQLVDAIAVLRHSAEEP